MVIGFFDSSNWTCISRAAAVLSHSIMSDSLQPLELWPQRLLCAWNSPGKNSRASCHSLLQRSSRPRLQNSKICWTQRLGWDNLNHSLPTGLSCVAQQWRICLQCRRYGFDSWVRKILGSGRSPGEGNGNPLQYSCLENPMDRGAWQATVYGVAKESDTV